MFTDRYPVEELELEWVSQTKVIIDKFPGFDLIALENFIELEARLAGAECLKKGMNQSNFLYFVYFRKF